MLTVGFCGLTAIFDPANIGRARKSTTLMRVVKLLFMAVFFFILLTARAWNLAAAVQDLSRPLRSLSDWNKSASAVKVHVTLKAPLSVLESLFFGRVPVCGFASGADLRSPGRTRKPSLAAPLASVQSDYFHASNFTYT